MICPACDGDGELVTSHRFTCYGCKGTGNVTDLEFIKILNKEKEIQKEMDKQLRAEELRQME